MNTKKKKKMSVDWFQPHPKKKILSRDFIKKNNNNNGTTIFKIKLMILRGEGGKCGV